MPPCEMRPPEEQALELQDHSLSCALLSDMETSSGVTGRLLFCPRTLGSLSLAEGSSSTMAPTEWPETSGVKPQGAGKTTTCSGGKGLMNKIGWKCQEVLWDKNRVESKSSTVGQRDLVQK